MKSEIQDRDNQISHLDRVTLQLHEENEQLAESFNCQHTSQAAEPPQDSYNPIVDLHPSVQCPLVSDVGSTGAWRTAEESKHASPDPCENLLHQSTGATSQQVREDAEPPMPPLEDSPSHSFYENSTHQDYHREDSEEEKTPLGRSFIEEDKESGTPRREDALSGRASRTSTPPRVTYERINSPSTSTSQRVHNLTSLAHPTHYSIPRQSEHLFDPNDFFGEMQRESEERRKRPSNLPRNFFE